MCSNSRWGFLINMHFYFQKTRFHVSNTLKYRNGYPQQHPPTVGLGGERLKYNQLSEAELDELANKVRRSHMDKQNKRHQKHLFLLIWLLTKR